MKKVLMMSASSATVGETMAQNSQAVPTSLLNDPLLPVYLTAAAMLVLLILVAGLAIYVIRVLNVLTKEAQERNPTTSQNSGSWWHRMFEKLNASVPVEQEKDIELEHSYDGIRELDNHLPPWWKWLFNASIVFSVAYLIVYHVTDSLPLSESEYKQELALADEQVRLHRAAQPQATIDESKLEYDRDAATIEKGKLVFLNNNCGGCHRNDGGGNTIGPNLADEYWLHGGNIKDIFATIKNGVVEKGMPAWGKSMSPQDVRDVTFFVMSLQGTNPPDGKAPQGELFRQVKAESDTIKTQAGL